MRGKQGTGNKAQGNLMQLTTKEKVDGYQHEPGADTARTVHKSGCVDANRGVRRRRDKKLGGNGHTGGALDKV